MDEITLTLTDFWGWLTSHPNCILRVGTPEAVIYDDDGLHWLFAMEEPDTMVIQAVRGKRLAAEILIAQEQVASVRGLDGDIEGEYVFEMMAEGEPEPFAAYYVVMAHGPEADDPTAAVH